MIVVDASVWISRLLSSETNHLVSRQWLETYLRNGGQLTEPWLLLVEAGAAVARRTSQLSLARQTLQDLLGLPIQWVALDGQLAHYAAQVAVALRLRGADAVYVALAQQLGVPLITWDNEQLTRGVAAAAVYTPATAPPLP